MLLNMVMFKVTICDLKNKDRNMADNIEHQDKGELVANCDRFNSLKHSTVRSYAFTEQGVAMLSTIFRSETAIRVSIRIMDAGQVYDAYTFVSDLIKSAKKRIVLIDNYVDETVLTLVERKSHTFRSIFKKII